jgi:hypothetical protein
MENIKDILNPQAGNNWAYKLQSSAENLLDTLRDLKYKLDQIMDDL